MTTHRIGRVELKEVTLGRYIAKPIEELTEEEIARLPDDVQTQVRNHLKEKVQ